jgi:hypothetical protein
MAVAVILSVVTVNNKEVTSTETVFVCERMASIRANYNPDGTGTPQINIPGISQFRYNESSGNHTAHWNKYTVEEYPYEILALMNA